MLTTMEIDGIMYHALGEGYDEVEGCYTSFEPIFDENGYMIPASVCLCFAHSASECMCGAWDSYVPEWEDLE
jgi:hypothetical protein